MVKAGYRLATEFALLMGELLGKFNDAAVLSNRLKHKDVFD